MVVLGAMEDGVGEPLVEGSGSNISGGDGRGKGGVVGGEQVARSAPGHR